MSASEFSHDFFSDDLYAPVGQSQRPVSVKPDNSITERKIGGFITGVQPHQIILGICFFAACFAGSLSMFGAERLVPELWQVAWTLGIVGLFTLIGVLTDLSENGLSKLFDIREFNSGRAKVMTALGLIAYMIVNGIAKFDTTVLIATTIILVSLCILGIILALLSTKIRDKHLSALPHVHVEKSNGYWLLLVMLVYFVVVEMTIVAPGGKYQSPLGRGDATLSDHIEAPLSDDINAYISACASGFVFTVTLALGTIPMLYMYFVSVFERYGLFGL